MAMFLASFADAAWNDYTTVRNLKMDAAGVERLEVVAGAGSMVIEGVPGLENLVVIATVVVPELHEDDAIQLIDKKMKLSLDRNGEHAKLDAWFEDSLPGRESNASINLRISVPTGIALSIEDGSGSIELIGIEADVSINDGSGSIRVVDALNVDIDDGSGSIEVSRAAGNVSIVDGSGSITIRSVGGSVKVDDGSGSINVSDVAEDLTIIGDGSGSLSYSDVRGRVDENS
jgi:hypothetical protein